MNLISSPKPNSNKAFTLIGFLVAIVILDVLAAAVIMILNPAELLA